MKKAVEKKIKYEDATTNRDSIAKGIYERIFLWLGERINAELYQTDEQDQFDILFIGILDVFGFENFWINSMEQFCINFTNEKLQQFFNYHIIKSEQEEYIKESVFWTPIAVPDNVDYMKMVENKDYGFFTLLDSACKAPQPDVAAFMQELFKRHKSCKAIKTSKAPGAGNARGGPAKGKKKKKGGGERFTGFIIYHFADNVCYDASKFLAKNMEAVHPDTAKMMKKSKIALISQIAGKKDTSKKKLTVTGKFWKGIKTLMKNLKATEPYFVRCVNPNMQKSSTIWTESVVEHQLRCGGLVEALKVLKLGYPTRVPYATLYDKYHSTVTNPLIKNMGPESFSTALLIAFDVSEADYELGLTKIFFKPAKAAILDTIMNAAGKPLTAEQNDKITKWVVQKRIKQVIGSCKAFLELRKRVRLARAEKRWEFCGRVASILSGTVIRHLEMAREIILKRKKEAGALALQSYFRGKYERARYIKHIDKVKKSCKMIWISYRRWNERVELKKWIDPKVEATRKRKEEERRRKEEEERKRLAEMAELERQQMLEEQRKKRQEQLDAQRKKREEERKQKEEEERKRREEEERARIKAEEEERKRQEEEERKRREEEEAARIKKEEQEREEARLRQIKASEDLATKKKAESKRKHREERERREASIKIKKTKRKKAETKRREQREEAYARDNFPENYDSDSAGDGGDASGSDISTDDDSMDDAEASIEVQLKHFDKTAATGQLFLKYTGKRRRKPQDRIVKVSFDNKAKPKQISWGSGSRHLDFSDILYIAWGHWTPVFQARKDQLNPKLCFSVVGKQQILDVQATNKKLAELWVKGLRRLIGQTDEQANKLAKDNLDTGNLPGSNNNDQNTKKKIEKEHKKRTKSLMLLQQDLFVMTTTTVFRNLEEERIWDIDNSIREKFNPKVLYELALREDVPWRQWNHWIREKIVTYLRDNNRVSKPQPMYGGYGMQQPMQQPYNPYAQQQPNPYQQPMQQPQYSLYHQQQPMPQSNTMQQPMHNKQSSMYNFQQPKPQPTMNQPQQIQQQQPPQQAYQNFAQMQMPSMQQPQMPAQGFNMPPQGGGFQQPMGQGGAPGPTGQNAECNLM